MTILRAVPATAAVILLLLIAACARADDAGGAEDAGSAGGAGSSPADSLVLQVRHTGGFLTPTMLATRLPILSVYADGRVITEGPQVLSYPPPALPNVQIQRIDPAAVATLVDRARAAGIGGSAVDYGRPPIADAPSTRFTLVTDEGTDVVEVYALGEAQLDDPGLTDAQVRARAALRDLLEALTDLPEMLGDDAVTDAGAYQPAALAAVVSPWTPDETMPDLPEIAWPGPELPGEIIGPDVNCVTAAGDEAAEALAAARPAKSTTPWVSGGERWRIGLRPLLPDETGCDDLTD